MLVRRLREFSRGFTRVIGALDYGHRLGTPYSLPEARVLYELARGEWTRVAELRRELDMDAGQLSRLLARSEESGLIRRERDAGDSRRQLVALSPRGREAAALLDDRSTKAVGELVGGLSPAEHGRLLAALSTASRLLRIPADTAADFRLRPPQPGELGWVIQRHGALYTAEYGWNGAFEALVAKVVAEFAAGHDPEREAAWIAEWEGEPVGSVFCVDEGAERAGGVPTARLRLLLVEPHARGLGIGRALVEECLRFARAAGYRRVVLWTNDVLVSARRIYQAAGFTLVATRPHTDFGPEERGQDWELTLTPGEGQEGKAGAEQQQREGAAAQEASGPGA
ncbi:bifunctional helix-turn-helix transcriptional regulator/GNAT family N-acetyltransferase [Streptomyces hoynatensis]|uniref:MarR family transcriptional regulator n=1 Tax=Streptomyces hoynatensis TaxID=1141874 RepID=A0A3A9Z2M7_9ACTN|nr:helix-turn-helix domain-containing GNAT family N-acetyltransferase [Streptomyces hoynatensis]RKN42493.1 MarR family transcriptional regulator [Streptomyces hoynatensis]